MNGATVSMGLMIWAYVSMRAFYQAEEAKTWFGFVQAIIGIAAINYFCFQLILNSASLNDFSRDEVDGIGLAFVAGTIGAVITATIRARRRLGHPNSEIDASLGAEEIQIQLDDKKRKLGITVPDRDRK